MSAKPISDPNAYRQETFGEKTSEPVAPAVTDWSGKGENVLDFPAAPRSEPAPTGPVAEKPEARSFEAAGDKPEEKKTRKPRKWRSAFLKFGGFVAFLAALFVIIGEQLAMVSANALVNAQVTTLRAPIAGVISLERRELGALVRHGELLAQIDNPRADRQALDDLELERSIREAEITRLEAEQATLVKTLAGLDDPIEKFRTARLRAARAVLAGAEASVEAAEAARDTARTELERSQQLIDRGLRPDADHELTVAEFAEADAILRLRQSEVRTAQAVLDAAESNIFLGDGINERPFSAQQKELLQIRAGDVAAALLQERARLAAVERRLDAERMRNNRLRVASVLANVDGRVWRRIASDGESIERGQDLIQLVDCRSSIVTLSVSEGVYNRLEIGGAAQFRLDEDEDRLFDGRILRLAGSGAREIYGELAIAPSQRHLERFDVAISVPGLRGDANLGCAIGRTGRAFFGSRPLDWFRGLFT